MRRKIGLILTIILILGVLSACGSNELPEGFVEEELVGQAQNVVALMSAGDYEGTAAMFSPAMAEQLDAAALESAVGEKLNELGEFDSFTSTSISGGSDKKIGDFGVVVLVCKYQNGNAKYTISIDENDQICGLYLK